MANRQSKAGALVNHDAAPGDKFTVGKQTFVVVSVASNGVRVRHAEDTHVTFLYHYDRLTASGAQYTN